MNWTLVTGGAKGIGAAICLELAKQRRNLVIHYRKSEQQAQYLVASCRNWGVKVEKIYGDFSTQEGLVDFTQRYLTHFNQTIGLVNNVGTYFVQPLSATTHQHWLSLFQTNFFTPIFLIDALSDSLKQQQGCVVTLGTVSAATSRIYSKAVAYGVSKKALYQALLAYAKELAPYHVRINMVSPGYVKGTDIADEKELPMKRTATIEEVARMVAFLFSDEGQYITGQNVEVAGGFGL